MDAVEYFKLNKRMNKNDPAGSVCPMMEDISSASYVPSGEIISINDYPLLGAFIVGNQDYFRAVETTNFSLSATGQMTLNQVASSPSEIISIGANSKIYRSTDGVTWASIDCPAPAGVFTGSVFLEYSPFISKFYISERISNHDWVYTSANGTTWTVYDIGVLPTIFGSGDLIIGTSILKNYPQNGDIFGRFLFGYDYGLTDFRGNLGSPSIYWTQGSVLYLSGLKTKMDSADWSKLPMCSTHIATYFDGYYTEGGSLIPENSGGNIFCVNGLYSNKIFYRNGYNTSSTWNHLTAYASSFTFPTTNMMIVYDVANNRYLAINRDTNQFYTSADGITWSAPATIGAGSYTINGVAIRHNQSTLVAIGSIVKTSTNNGSSWTTQTLPTINGSFSKIAVNPSGVAIISALNSSTTAKATNGANFDLVSITDTADWQNVFWSGTMFILTSRTLQLKTSADGTTWTSQSNHTAFTNASHYITSMCNISTNLCAISSASVDTLTSTTGTSWTKRASTVPVGLTSIAGGLLLDTVTNRMVAVGTNICYYNDSYGTTAFTSATIGTGGWSNLIYEDHKFVCISLTTPSLAWSRDGITWTVVATPIQPKSLVYAGDMFVIKGSSYLVTTVDLVEFGLQQPCEDTGSGATTVYDPISTRIITANTTSISYAISDSTKLRLPYIASNTSGMVNYIKVS